MARRQSSAALTPSHFKHFAIFTVLATACLALFANGESRNELGREIAQTEQQAKAAVAEVARDKSKPLRALGNKIHDARTTYVPLPGEDGYGDMSYGRPMDGGGGGGGGGGGSFAPASRYTGGPPIIGDGESQASVRPAESVAGGGTGSRPKRQRRPTDEELDRLEAASEARS